MTVKNFVLRALPFVFGLVAGLLPDQLQHGVIIGFLLGVTSMVSWMFIPDKNKNVTINP